MHVQSVFDSMSLCSFVSGQGEKKENCEFLTAVANWSARSSGFLSLLCAASP